MHTETLTNLTVEDLGWDSAIGEKHAKSSLAAARGIITGCIFGGVIWAAIGYFLFA